MKRWCVREGRCIIMCVRVSGVVTGGAIGMGGAVLEREDVLEGVSGCPDDEAEWQWG